MSVAQLPRAVGGSPGEEPTAPRFSFVLLSYGRPYNLPAILNNIFDQPFVDDAVVVHQGTRAIYPDQLGLQPDRLKRVLLRIQPENHFTYTRFMACRCCRHDSILTCDDDNLVQNWPDIAASFCANPEVITSSLDDGHLAVDKKNRWGSCHEVLLGWGAAFDRRWIGEVFKRYIDAFGHDALLDRKADRIFSMLLNRHHNVIPARFRELPGAMDVDVALYKRSDHWKLTDDARKRVWGLLRQR